MSGGRSLRRVLDLPVEDWLGTAAMAATLVVMATQVFLRYVLNQSLIWSEELSRYLLIAMVFLGTATATRRDQHIRIDLIDHLLPAALARGLRRATDLLVLAYLAYVAWSSIEMLAIFSTQPSSALGVPMAVPYGAVTVGFGLAALRLVLGLVARER
ncbi:MAG: TRAP transporter small permease [Alphaproteobacteria bacterium]|nr:TRAP transporter small permease [Alphaproteobacteria bacterium]